VCTTNNSSNNNSNGRIWHTSGQVEMAMSLLLAPLFTFSLDCHFKENHAPFR